MVISLMRRPLTSRALSEQQRHAVGFTNRLERFVARGPARRNLPHAADMVGRVLRIGVDLAAVNQLETMRLDELDQVLLAQITVVAIGIGVGRIALGTVLDNAQQA